MSVPILEEFQDQSAIETTITLNSSEAGSCFWEAISGTIVPRDSAFELFHVCLSDMVYYPKYNEALVDWLNENEIPIKLELNPSECS